MRLRNIVIFLLDVFLEGLADPKSRTYIVPCPCLSLFLSTGCRLGSKRICVNPHHYSLRRHEGELKSREKPHEKSTVNYKKLDIGTSTTQAHAESETSQATQEDCQPVRQEQAKRMTHLPMNERDPKPSLKLSQERERWAQLQVPSTSYRWGSLNTDGSIQVFFSAASSYEQ